MRRDISRDVVKCALRNLGWHGELVWADTFCSRLLGMLKFSACDGRCAARIMVLPRCRSVHTCAMRYRLDIAFIDSRGSVLSRYDDVPPGKFIFDRRASFVVERPSFYNAVHMS